MIENKLTVKVLFTNQTVNNTQYCLGLMMI